MAPAPGRVLSVPVTKGSVVMPGETIARIAGGGYFLRLSLPERHAAHIKQGDSVLVGGRGIGACSYQRCSSCDGGKLVKVYPEIESGRVLADVEVDGLGDFFVGERTLVWIPVGQRQVHRGSSRGDHQPLRRRLCAMSPAPSRSMLRSSLAKPSSHAGDTR